MAASSIGCLNRINCLHYYKKNLFGNYGIFCHDVISIKHGHKVNHPSPVLIRGPGNVLMSQAY